VQSLAIAQVHMPIVGAGQGELGCHADIVAQ
jgi:hypothetical protein